jgi:hypothetical protein
LELARNYRSGVTEPADIQTRKQRSGRARHHAVWAISEDSSDVRSRRALSADTRGEEQTVHRGEVQVRLEMGGTDDCSDRTDLIGS